ncbi:MAG TPA: crotonase/enoyl-CoA hydratase family protein [Acidimicrobiales bacterium]|jgi:enoyl-CoA hydratase/carnithine racemase|nr:crotonase/enoyl-CoA hydratase family protein [Acidimicrobiales bacterium]
MSDRVTVTMDGGVADVRMNRPDKRNALDPAMFEALVVASDELAADPSVRAVVLSGEGVSFCAGLDFSSFQAMAGSDAPPRAEGAGKPRLPRELGARDDGRITNRPQQAAWGWAELPVPVIAAVHGHALGGGFQIAMAADIRITAPDAKFSVLEIRWGLVPDMTGVPQLVRHVGLDVAKELTWTGRIVSGTEAVELGLATRTSDDPRTDALALAHEIAGKNPHAIRAGKRLLHDVDQRPLAESLVAESIEMGQLIGSPNQVEAVTAYFEQREPQFADPEA